MRNTQSFAQPVLPPPWEATRFRAMGTECSVVVIDGPIGLAAFAEAEVARCEARWSRFRQTSELCRLNAAAGGGLLCVSRDTFAVIERAIELWRTTDGWFDPTVFDSLIAAGYDSSFEHVRARRAFTRSTRPSRTPGCDGIELDDQRCAIRLPAGVHLDLGGVGKGFAADLVAERVIERGARGVCVELGGDIRVLGDGPTGNGWTIEVEDPFDGDRTLICALLDHDAIVTTSRLFRRWSTTDGDAHHLIDPTTGASACTGVAAVVARARDATLAEGVAKAVLVAGVDRGVALAAGLHVACWIVMDDQRVVAVHEGNAV